MMKYERELKKRYITELGAVEDIDKEMIKESIKNYINDMIDYREQVCLDLGSNIGSFVKIALDGGAKFVYGIECDSRNYEICSNNFKTDIRTSIVQAAVSSLDDDTIKIYKSNAKANHSSTSILKRKGTFKEYDEVKNYNIDDLLFHTKPDIVKIDIEGAEYSILESVLEYHPDVLFVELHVTPSNGEDVSEALRMIFDKYPENEISPITAFGRTLGYDCVLYK